MSGYSIGDRVAVQWKDVVYPAKVIKLRPSGEVDVVYEAFNTVGVFLTAKEHGLKLLPEKWGSLLQAVENVRALQGYTDAGTRITIQRPTNAE